MNDRKIVQVQTFVRDGDKWPDGIIALADDGTLWLGDIADYADRNPQWRQLRGLPQED